MKATVKKLISDYFKVFNGDQKAFTFELFIALLDGELLEAKDAETIFKLKYLKHKLSYGLAQCKKYGGTIHVVMEDSEDSLEEAYEKHMKEHPAPKRKVAPKRKHKGKGKGNSGKRNLGKLVDEGDVPDSGRADSYWGKQGMTIVFKPNNAKIRSGITIPGTYKFGNMKFLESYYGLRAFEFGNWLSQQDRVNYVAGLGLALFDLYHVLEINPKNLGLGKRISVAFGARGRGSALAHFEPGTFAINLTRYSRPSAVKHRPKDFDRANLLTASGGVGCFAHEYGHALDYYAGMFLDKHSSGAISHGRTLRTKPDKGLMKSKSLQGHMERLIAAIVVEKDGKPTPYYKRLEKGNLTDYYFRRNEIFARAFEAYVHYKLDKKKYKNIFLTETKYQENTYLTAQELKKIEKLFDTLLSAIGK